VCQSTRGLLAQACVQGKEKCSVNEQESPEGKEKHNGNVDNIQRKSNV